MTPDEARDLVWQSHEMLDPVRLAFPCKRCGGKGELKPHNYYDPCPDCDANGFDIPDEEDDE